MKSSLHDTKYLFVAKDYKDRNGIKDCFEIRVSNQWNPRIIFKAYNDPQKNKIENNDCRSACCNFNY